MYSKISVALFTKICKYSIKFFIYDHPGIKFIKKNKKQISKYCAMKSWKKMRKYKSQTALFTKICRKITFVKMTGIVVQ
jgi:hypothetical protein